MTEPQSRTSAQFLCLVCELPTSREPFFNPFDHWPDPVRSLICPVESISLETVTELLSP